MPNKGNIIQINCANEPKINVKQKAKIIALKIPKYLCLNPPGTSVGKQNKTPRAILKPMDIRSNNKFEISIGATIAKAKTIAFKKLKLIKNLFIDSNISI